MQQGEGGSLLLAVFCRDAEFLVVFFASCPMGALPYRFSIATHSSMPFSLRRVLGDCVSVWFRAATQSFGLFSLRCVLCGLCRTVSQSRRKVLWRFLCVVSWEGVLLCGSVPRRRVLGRFSCVVSYLMSSSVVKGWVKQARDEVSDQNRMMRISGATRYGVVRMKRSHWAMKYVTRTR